MPDIIILGPQADHPNLMDATRQIVTNGAFCSITAGWQQREGEVQELQHHLDREVEDLHLYQRLDHALGLDPELADAHRTRQAGLRQRQRWYRRRLHHAMEAYLDLAAETGSSAALLAEQRSALNAIRALDRHHVRQIDAVHAVFNARWRPAHRPAMAEQRDAIVRRLDAAAAVLVAGGHVAALLSRLRLFGLESELREKRLIAWSAGAMALSERVVLFHDSPPQGPGHAEILDSGLGLLPRLLPLPHARERLRLHDPRRVALMARRFNPLQPVTLDAGSLIRVTGHKPVMAQGTARLTARGNLAGAPLA